LTRLKPLFLTSIFTTGKLSPHTDVSLWYVLKGNHRDEYDYDSREFNSIQSFSFDEIPYDNLDSNLQRFISKLKEML
jgi:hypothetical protein